MIFWYFLAALLAHDVLVTVINAVWTARQQTKAEAIVRAAFARTDTVVSNADKDVN